MIIFFWIKYLPFILSFAFMVSFPLIIYICIYIFVHIQIKTAPSSIYCTCYASIFRAAKLVLDNQWLCSSLGKIISTALRFLLCLHLREWDFILPLSIFVGVVHVRSCSGSHIGRLVSTPCVKNQLSQNKN